MGSSIVERFDPEALRAQIEAAKMRVAGLKRGTPLLSPDPGNPHSPLSPPSRDSASPPNREEEAKRELESLQGLLSELKARKTLLEAKLSPGQASEDAASLALLHEKEALLKELKSVALAEQDQTTAQVIWAKISALEADLKASLAQPELEARLQAAKLLSKLKRDIRGTAERLETLIKSVSSVSLPSSAGSLTSSAASLEDKPNGSFTELRSRVTALLTSPNLPQDQDSISDKKEKTMVNDKKESKPLDRSVSNAVSDESVAGDSGVFDSGSEEEEPAALSLTTAFDATDDVLVILVGAARHLRKLPGNDLTTQLTI